MATKTVSLRVDVADLQRVEQAGLSPTEVMREALHRKAVDLRIEAWSAKVKTIGIKLPPGSPSSTELIRQMRDER